MTGTEETPQELRESRDEWRRRWGMTILDATHYQDEIAALQDEIGEVLELHAPVSRTYEKQPDDLRFPTRTVTSVTCKECRTPHPCRTVRLMQKAVSDRC